MILLEQCLQVVQAKHLSQDYDEQTPILPSISSKASTIIIQPTKTLKTTFNPSSQLQISNPLSQHPLNPFIPPYFSCPSFRQLIITPEYLILLSMSRSVMSKASNASSRMLQQIANRSQTKIYKVQGSFNDEEMRIIWNSLGLYISRNLRMGRGVNIPKLGIFTFTPPEVRLKGVTNELERDQQPRTPVFLIQKDFVKGVNLRTAIFYHQQFGAGLRPYSAIGATGEVPITKMNLIEISSYANMSKDATQLGLNRIIKYIGEKLLNGENITIEIPNLGQLICRNHLVAVKFNEYIQRDTRNILAKSVDQRKLKGNMSLTSDNLKRFSNLSEMSQKLAGKTQEFFDIDDNARRYLSSNFDLHIDDSNLKRSVTNFDRTVATKMFNKTNQSLKDSRSYRLTQSGFYQTQIGNKEFNLALKIVREWVKEHDYNSEEGFQAFCGLISKKSQVLNENQLWNACKQISIDITEQQAQELFRILDNNKDGLITLDDWKASVQFSQNNAKFKELLHYIRGKRYNLSKILSILGLEGVRKVSVFTLKNGLMKLWSNLSQDNALLLSKYIAKGKEEVDVEQIIDTLNLKEEGVPTDADQEWQARFFARLKRKLTDSGLVQEELANRFRLYDKSDSGYIEQTDFKTVLAELGVNISLTELIKLVKFVPLNGQNHLKYQYVIDQLGFIAEEAREELSEHEFKKVIKENFMERVTFALPISVGKLTSLLQSKYFKKYSEKQVLKFVRGIDLNEDETVTEDDLKGYRQLIRDKTYKQLCPVEVQDLLIKLRQKSIKKKISYYDLFKKLDKVGSGFITHQGWLSNIDEIISFTKDQKQNLFNHMDRNKNKMIDYKTFLAIMNGHNNLAQSENFNWVDEALERLKTWFRSSHLTVEDAFKLVDKDGDTYINQKDLHEFLVQKLKYQEREISMVRVQKFIKLMDYYKHGRITFLDWHKLINQEKDWLKDAKKQIGIVLSKKYSSLAEAFTTITQGDKRLIFTAFDKWVRANYVLSGFMINQDMLKTVFGSLDQHKKGYLLENDFIGLFGSYNWKSQHCKEITDFLVVKFKSAEEAFKYMSQFSGKAIDFERFKQILTEFFGNRFHPSDAENIWHNIAGGKDKLDLAQFKRLHGDLWNSTDNEIDSQFPKDSWRYQDFSIIKGTTIRSNEHEYAQKEKMEDQCTKFINNLKDIIATSPKTLEQVFSEVDKQKSGKITNLMFKKAFRTLNIALTSKEIDLLLNYCEFKPQTLIDWKQFIKMLDIQEDKQKIRARLQPKLQHISDLLHYYMISPKDAYRKWNNPRSGYLSFEEFFKMMKELYAQASEPLPQYQQLEDLFTFIDIRKDNQLDFQEFTQVFRNCNPPNLLMGTTPAPSNQLLSKTASNKQQNLPIRQKSIPLFRHSPEYQKFVQLIGRNRKYLQQQIQKSNSEKVAFIPFQTVEAIITAFCNKHGLRVDSNMVRNLIAFTMTGEKVDYHLLVSKFKDMSIQISEFPKRKVF